MTRSPDDEDLNETNELAKERNREAAERTLMAWIRTCLALIGFGFGIDRIVNAVEAGRASTGLTAVVGSCFMALGIYGLISASIDYKSQIRLLAAAHYKYRPRRSQTLVLAAVLAIVGIVAFAGIIVQALQAPAKKM